MSAFVWLRRAASGAVAGMLLCATLEADAAVFSCDDPGVQTAAATGGGPHTFSCAGPTTVVLSGMLSIFASVILDGGGDLTVSAGYASQVLSVGAGSVEFRDLDITAGRSFGAAGGCIVVTSGASLTLTGVTVSDCSTVVGSSHNIGGAIVNDGSLTLTDAVVTGNTGSIGAGIASGFSSPTAGVTLTRSSVSGNTPSFAIGGIHVFAGNLAVTDSAISGNASIGLGIQGVAGTHTITRSTVSGNGSFGINSSSAALALSNSTVAQNGDIGINNSGASAVLISNSTLAGNAAANLAGPATVLDTIVSGTCGIGGRVSQGGNVESPGNSCGFNHASDQVNVSAAALALGTLANNGGPTASIPLLAGSLAIGSAVSCPPPATDQRGVPRPQGVGCDSGAFELVPSVPLLSTFGIVALAAALVAAGLLALRHRRPA